MEEKTPTRITIKTIDGESLVIDEDIAHVSMIIKHELFVKTLKKETPKELLHTFILPAAVPMDTFKMLVTWMTEHRGENGDNENREANNFDTVYLVPHLGRMTKIGNAAFILGLPKLLHQYQQIAKKMDESEELERFRNIGKPKPKPSPKRNSKEGTESASTSRRNSKEETESTSTSRRNSKEGTESASSSRRNSKEGTESASTSRRNSKEGTESPSTSRRNSKEGTESTSSP